MATSRIDTPEALFAKLERTFVQRPAYGNEQLDWAFDVAITAWSLVDWTARTRGASKSVVRDAFIARCPELGVCEQVANGAKHLVLTHSRLMPFDISKDVELTNDLVGISGILIPGGPPVDLVATPDVAITDRNGVSWRALDMFHKVVRFWRNELSITTPRIAP